MNPALLLMGVYILVTFVLQALFFGVSQIVDRVAPDWSLLVFLILFMCAYGFGWPIAVRITEPKTVEDALRQDLLTLQKAGTIGRFSVEHRKDGPFVQVTRGGESPANLREVLVNALGHAVTETRISVST
jgi:membrane protein implicated in regulation of membrane protease activity